MIVMDNYKYICVFCGTETNKDFCEICDSSEGILTPNELVEIEEFIEVINSDV